MIKHKKLISRILLAFFLLSNLVLQVQAASFCLIERNVAEQTCPEMGKCPKKVELKVDQTQVMPSCYEQRVQSTTEFVVEQSPILQCGDNQDSTKVFYTVASIVVLYNAYLSPPRLAPAKSFYAEPKPLGIATYLRTERFRA